MNEKKAFVNAIFGTMEAVDGAKKVGKAFNDTNNKYDDLMGTKLVKGTKNMGIQNSMVSAKTSTPKKLASEQLDYLVKEAKFINKDNMRLAMNAIKQVPGAAKKVIDNFDANNTKHIKNTIDSIKGKQYMNAMHHGLAAAPGTALGAGMIAGAGMGVSKGLKKLDGSDNPQHNLEYDAIGGALSATMALKALSSRRMLAPTSKALGVLANQATKIPVNAAKNSPIGKTVTLAGNGLKNTVTQSNKIKNDINYIGSNIDKLMNNTKNPMTLEQAKKHVIDAQLQNVRNQNWSLSQTDPAKLQGLLDSRMMELDQAMKTISELKGKKASETIDEMYKIAGAKTDYINGVVKNKFFKAGLESLPYYAGTAMIGLAVDKKVQQKEKDIELYKAHQALKSKENQPEKQEKVASAEAVFFKNQTANKVFKQSIESAVEGVGRMAIPLAASTVIGRDITNSLRKTDKKSKDNGTSPDEASIQLSRKDRKQMQKDIGNSKTAEELLSNTGDVVEEITREIERDVIGAGEKLDGDKVHIGHGVKKQFRMNPIHGMHGMTE